MQGTFCTVTRNSGRPLISTTSCQSFLFVDLRQKLYPRAHSCPPLLVLVQTTHCKFAEAHTDTLESPSVTMAVTKKEEKNTVGIQLILNKMVI